MLKDRLDILEAQRPVLTIELRNALIRAAKDLLPPRSRRRKGHPPARASPHAPPAPHFSASSRDSQCAPHKSTRHLTVSHQLSIRTRSGPAPRDGRL